MAYLADRFLCNSVQHFFLFILHPRWVCFNSLGLIQERGLSIVGDSKSESVGKALYYKAQVLFSLGTSKSWVTSLCYLPCTAATQSQTEDYHSFIPPSASGQQQCSYIRLCSSRQPVTSSLFTPSDQASFSQYQCILPNSKTRRHVASVHQSINKQYRGEARTPQLWEISYFII